MLQEVKALQFSLDINMKFIWRKASYFFINHYKGKGGAALLVSKRWAKFVKSWDFSPYNRVVWITLTYKDYIFGFASIYAPNDHREHIYLWN